MPELPRIIALHGEQYVGKDTVARYLADAHGYVPIAFADKLREMALALNPVVSLELNDTLIEQIRDTGTTSIREIRAGRLADVVERLGWDEAKLHYSEVRRTLQRLATDTIRNHVDSTFFAKHAVGRVLDALFQDQRAVLTDLRFANEEQELHRLAVPAISPAAAMQIWWIQRPKNPHRDRQITQHVSEHWHPVRFRPLINDTEKDLPGLHAKVEAILAGKVAELHQPPAPVTEIVEVHQR